MGILPVVHELEWKMRLTEGGYTCFELINATSSLRWAWIINAGATGWTAHVGSWSVNPVPVPDVMETFDRIESAKSWVEEAIAAWWTAT